jgi:WD40 repeat protein
MMKLYHIVVLTLVLILVAGYAQAQSAGDLFNDGGTPIAFTSDDQFLVAPRYEVPPEPSVETPITLFMDVYRVNPFERIDSYPLGGLDLNRPETIESVAISYDARFIAYVQMGSLYVFDRTTGETNIAGPNFVEYEGIEFNPVNHLLAYVVGRGITVLNATNSNVQYELFDNVYGGRVNDIAWSPDGRYLAHGVFRGGETGHDVVVWDVTALLPGINREPAFALLGGEPVHVAWRDSNTLASFGSGGVSIFDVPTRSLIVFVSSPSGLLWSDGDWNPDGTRLIASGSNTAASEPAIQIWDVSNLPAYESISYQEGIIGGDIHWLDDGLFYQSRGGLRRNDELLSVQLTATALFITPTPTP